MFDREPEIGWFDDGYIAAVVFLFYYSTCVSPHGKMLENPLLKTIFCSRMC
jgi:hypothetical protein